MAKAGLINPGLLRWLLGHTGTGGNSYEWGSSARSIAMALALDDLVSNNMVFNHDGDVFTCSWASGPPRCIQEHGAEQRDAVDDVDEVVAFFFFFAAAARGDDDTGDERRIWLLAASTALSKGPPRCPPRPGL